jgi:Transport and Golgi organisation 2
VCPVCTVVTSWQPGAELQILAIRDELMSRDFDEPGAWWPEHPGVVGGRDRVAGGSWCVSDVATGTTSLVLNRTERRTGTPSRGVLPLAAVEHGESWTEHVDHQQMASFTLVLASPAGVVAWTWTGEPGAGLTRDDLAAGTHLFTSNGVDPTTPKGERYARRFATEDWLDVVTSEEPADDLHALIIRHPIGPGDADTGAAPGEVYGTVFGQLLTTRPGALTATWSRTPWLVDDWSELTLPQQLPDRH